jgi:hypothetical protein
VFEFLRQTCADIAWTAFVQVKLLDWRTRISGADRVGFKNKNMYCMLCYLCYITGMSRGKSGRIVIEVDPGIKRRLYATLALSGSTLKDWFLNRAADFMEEKADEGSPRGSNRSSPANQEIMIMAEEPPKYKVKKAPKTNP